MKINPDEKTRGIRTHIAKWTEVAGGIFENLLRNVINFKFKYEIKIKKINSK